jgi:hypothetical protein
VGIQGTNELAREIKGLYDYLEERCKFQLDRIEQNAEAENINGVIKRIIQVVTECLTALYEGAPVNEFRNLQKNLQKNVRAHREGICQRKLPGKSLIDTYTAYVYLIRLSIFNAIHIGLPGGWSYDEFVKNIFAENEIDGEWKRESTNYRKYISDINLGQDNYIGAILAIRRNHRGVSDKNKNKRRWEYESILPYERAGQEFEFFMRKRNTGSKNKLQQEQIELFRKQNIEPLLSKHKIEISSCQSQYAKLKKMQIGEMSLLELQEYLKYVDAKKDYISEYEKPEYRIAGILKVEEDLLLNNLEIRKILDLVWAETLNNKYVIRNLKAKGYTLWKITRRNYEDNAECRKKISVLWNAMAELLNYVDAEIDKARLGIGKVENLYVFREAWKNAPKLCINDSIEKLRHEFIKPLLLDDVGLADYIRLSLMLKYMIFTDEEADRLEVGVKSVFEFQKICKKKAMDQEDIDINEELPEDTRAEIFERQIYDMANPLHIHQTILLELAYPFTATIKVNIYEGLYINFAENDDLINI